VTASALSSSGGLLEKASASATCAIGQSCSPANWIGLGLMNGWYKYKSNQKVGAIFAGAKTSDFTALAKLTLFQALRGNNQKSALQNAAAQLIKEAVGALLNAAHPNVGYPLKDPQSIITQVNAALTSKDVPTIKALTQTLKTYNLLGGAPAICEVNPPC
jgi:hypothetical protein